MKAVMLRDLRTRFFDHGIGFLIVSWWPLAHIFILLFIYQVSNRATPFGDSLRVFFATGLIPTLLFTYVSRFMSLSVILNKPMLAFPVVQVVDILMARAALEIVAAALTLAQALLILWLMGDNPFPYDLEQAVLAYLTILLAAIGVGIWAGVITMIMPFFATLYALFCIIIYLASGSLFVVSALPDAFAIPLAYSPVVQAVEWMRSAYYPSYSDRLVDKTYLLHFALVSVFSGLFMERVFRRILIEG
ncbi:capsular biosynthesis protein [Ensifer sp. ENS10]|nr:capsular biosynthesis protein [Ensifer sp. ENS10]